MNQSLMRTEADLEAIVLHENMNAFSSIINKDLYEVLGDPPEQNILFHNASCFDLFCIHVFELFAERHEVGIINERKSLSLFSGAKWLAEKYQQQFDVADLFETIGILESWLHETPKFSFWCGEIGRQIEFNLSRRKLLHFGQLVSKHNLFSLTRLMKNLHDMSIRSGLNLRESDVLFLFAPFVSEIKENRIEYHSSYLVEMLCNYFVALNELVNHLYRTLRQNGLKCPDGISSEPFRSLYVLALRFANAYNKKHYLSLRPCTTKYLKLRY